MAGLSSFIAIASFQLVSLLARLLDMGGNIISILVKLLFRLETAVDPHRFIRVDTVILSGMLLKKRTTKK